MNGKIYKYFNRKKYEETGIETYYIGQTVRTIEERAGKDGSRYLKDSNTKFANAIKKWGWDAFECEILEEGIQTQEKLNEAEIKYIAEYDSYNNGYNSTIGGETSPSSVQRKKVYCIDLNLVFDSIVDAATYVNMERSSVAAACKDPNKYAGVATISNSEVLLHWRFATKLDEDKSYMELDPSVHIYNKNELLERRRRLRSRKVYCYELNKTFSSATEAANYVNSRSSDIIKACNGKWSTAGTFTIDDEDVKLTWAYDEFKDVNKKTKLLMVGQFTDTHKKKISEASSKRKVYCPELDMTFDSIVDAAEYIGIKARANITKVCKGERPYAGSYMIGGTKTKLTWKYID